jgi:type IV pilus assembly protein PilX
MNNGLFRARRAHQQGIALIVVMVMLLLSTILVLGSARLGWLNERMVGSESDHQRAFAAAEALIRDAERDIKGLQADGTTPCQKGPSFIGCRPFAAGAPFFPQNLADLDLLRTRVKAGTSDCLRGICLPATTDSLSREPWTTKLAAMTAGTGDTAVPARYGEFTGIDPAATGNALLQWSRPGVTPAVAARAWYWVEVFLYTEAAGIAAASEHHLAPDATQPFVYRITAYVQGMKPGTRVWLRSVYVPRPMADLE